mmetsp:Transcript_7241/g.15357  ORF Transcript_7241/g.15357 Transcript_7241/m.15357 type:complete len:422 (-) Transcript_7241:87-1352(-)
MSADLESPRRSSDRQPTRIKSFLRQNQGKPLKLTLSVLGSLAIVALYFYGLLLCDVGSGIDLRRTIDKDLTTVATASVYGTDEVVNLQPRSLADIALANAEVAYKKRVDYQNYLLKQEQEAAQRRENIKKKRAEEALRRHRQIDETVAHAANDTELEGIIDIPNPNTTAIDADGYVNRLTSLQVRRTPPLAAQRGGRGRRLKGGERSLGFLGFFLIMTCFTCVRVMLNRAIIWMGTANTTREQRDIATRDGSSPMAAMATVLTGGQNAATLRRTARARAYQRQFERFVDRLNAERTSNGEQPIPAETLRHLVNARDFTGNDYEQLHEYADRNGVAPGSIFNIIGATRAEIDRCPSRTVGSDDDLLRPRAGEMQKCSICLEHYQVGDVARTVPCFHSFHARCIDPWLEQRAECPICKHSAIG